MPESDAAGDETVVDEVECVVAGTGGAVDGPDPSVVEVGRAGPAPRAFA